MNDDEVIQLFNMGPDIILMDKAMPVMNGIEATKEILKKDPNAVAIGLNAYAEMRGKELGEAGAKKVIKKPFMRNGLIETIEGADDCC